MKLKTILLAAIILTISTALFAQKAVESIKPEPAKTVVAAKLPTVQEILAKYVKAIGGRTANEKIKSRSMTGTVELAPQGIKGTFETYTTGEAKTFTKMNLGGIGEMLDGSDGTTAWATNPIQGSREKTGVELAQAKLSGNFHREINLEKLFPKMELKGIEKVGSKDAYVIVATAENLPPETWYFDTVNGLMVRSDVSISSPEGTQSAKVFFDETRVVDGVTVPVKIRTQLAAFEIIMIAADVKHGVTIDEAKFAKPKQ